MNNSENIIKIRIDELIPNKYQPRKYFDENSLTELANSIKNYGILNPILVRKNGEKYEIIAGERRYRAAKLIGLEEVPVIVKNTTEQQTAEMALIENLERQDLTAIEAAKSYEEIIKLGGHTQSELAEKLGISQSALANKMRLLTLPNEVQEAVIKKQISERHARCLLTLEDHQKQLDILKRIIDEKLTVKETEEIIEIENITDADVAQAINDIMKSLNIKEEKESENMNNGNFFPNYDNNMNQNNNVPNINMAPVPPMETENVMPTNVGGPITQGFDNTNQSFMNPMPDLSQPVMPEPAPAPVAFDQPLFTNPTPDLNQPIMPESAPAPVAFDQPLFTNPTPDLSQPVMPEPTSAPVAFDQPLFTNPTPDLNQPIMPEPAPAPVAFDQPLFSMEQTETPNMMTPEPLPISNNFEIPVGGMPQQNNSQIDNLENFLNSNGIGYKKYQNETGICVIIEM